MSVGRFLKSGGWAAIAVACAASAVPLEASAQGRDRAERMAHERDGDRADAERGNGMAIRAQRVQQANEARARQAEERATQAQRQTEQRATQAQRQTEQRATQAQRQGDRQAEQATRQDNRQGRQADRGNQGSGQAGQAIDQAAREGVRRTQFRTTQAQQGERNRSYGDRDRNRSYTDGDRDGNGQRDRGDRNDGNRNDGDRRNNDNWQDGRRDGDRDGNWQGNRGNNDRWSDNRGRDDNRRWNRSWRDDNRYDWQRYRNSNRTVFRVGAYHSPYRYYNYRPYGVGGYMNSLFYGSNYWISNPWYYRLPDVWGPYRWVRYYDDVMLVDIYTGQVVDVIHNFFW